MDGQLIRNTVLKMDGAAGSSGLDAAAGSSGLDAAAWKQLCTSFKPASFELCDNLTAVARWLSTCFIYPSWDISFCWLQTIVALDKCPGVCPISIWKTARRIIGKVIAVTISEDIQEAVGPLQVCAGQISGCETVVHAIRQVFESQWTEAVLLVKHQMPSTHLTVRQLSTTFSSYAHLSQKSSSIPMKRIPNSL